MGQEGVQHPSPRAPLFYQYRASPSPPPQFTFIEVESFLSHSISNCFPILCHLNQGLLQGIYNKPRDFGSDRFVLKIQVKITNAKHHKKYYFKIQSCTQIHWLRQQLQARGALELFQIWTPPVELTLTGKCGHCISMHFG